MAEVLLLQEVVDVTDVFLYIGLTELIHLVGQALKEITVVGDDDEGAVVLD